MFLLNPFTRFAGALGLLALALATGFCTTTIRDIAHDPGIPLTQQSMLATNVVAQSEATQRVADAQLSLAETTAVLQDSDGNLIVAKAEATLTVAESCDIRNDCYFYTKSMFDKPGLVDLIFPILVAALVAVFIMIAVFGNRLFRSQ